MSVEMLTGHGRPTKYTAGIKGQRYKDLDTGDIYQCELDNEYSTIHGAPVGGYLWKLRIDGNGDSVVQDGASVKSINGVMPDGNGDVSMMQVKNLSIMDATAMNASILQYYGVETIDEIVWWLRDNTKYYVNFNREVKGTDGKTIETVTNTGADIYKVSDGVYNAIVYFGDKYAPIILDSANNKLTLDPDWVAPSASTSSDVIVKLTTTGNNINTSSVVNSDKSFTQITEELNGRGLENVRVTLNHNGDIFHPIAVSSMSDRIFFTFMHYSISVNTGTGTETPCINIYKFAFTKSSGTTASYITINNVKSAV
jgi:hypothetical protein